MIDPVAMLRAYIESFREDSAKAMERSHRYADDSHIVKAAALVATAVLLDELAHRASVGLKAIEETLG